MPPTSPQQFKLSHPAPFLEVRVDRRDLTPPLFGVCAGYDLDEWRCKELVAHLMEWLPEFALTYRESQALRAHNAVSLLGQAARAIYTSTKFKNRGELGELLLHAIIRQVFDTVPAISKYYFKDSRNDTVKGFDAVHVVVTQSDLQLWLGEVKFYDDISRAIRDITKELKEHTERDYLRGEFAAIMNKIDDSWPHSERLKKLLHRNTPLQDIFDVVCVPVLLTYDSSVIGSYSKVTADFKTAFEIEVLAHGANFAKKALPTPVHLHLFLFPMKCKAELIKEFDKKLKACQTI